MRSELALAAAVLAGLAAIASWWSHEDDTVAFFLVLGAVAVVIAALANGSWTGAAALVARSLAVAWVVAAGWIGAPARGVPDVVRLLDHGPQRS